MTVKEYLTCLALITTVIHSIAGFNEFDWDQHLEKDKSGNRFMISIKRQDQAKFNKTKTENNDLSLSGQDEKTVMSALDPGHSKGHSPTKPTKHGRIKKILKN